MNLGKLVELAVNNGNELDYLDRYIMKQLNSSKIKSVCCNIVQTQDKVYQVGVKPCQAGV